MQALGPLAAFQGLLITLAVGVAIDARKDAPPWRYILWVWAVALGLAGVLADVIANNFPASFPIMQVLGGNPTVWFVSFVALYFVLKPLRLSQIPPQAATVPTLYDDTEIRALTARNSDVLTVVQKDYADLKSRLEALSDVNSAITNDYQRMLSAESTLSGDIDGIKTAIQSEIRRIDDHLLITDRSVSMMRSDSAAVHNTLFLSIQAIRAREVNTRLSSKIRNEGKYLTSKILAGDPIAADDWEDWLSHEATFSSALNQWLDLSRGWHPEVAERVNKVNSDDLTDPAFDYVDDLLADPKSVTRYKIFALKFANWNRAEPQISTAIEIAAFGGPNASEMLSQIPGGGPTHEKVSSGF